MKKVLLFPVFSLLVACSSKPSYTKMVETTYNFNSSAVNLILESDTIAGDFVEVVKDGKTLINNLDGKLFLKLSSNTKPIKIELINEQDSVNILAEDRGYKITSEKVGDTLIIKHFPTKETLPSVLKFGTEYKFYN